MENNKKVMMKKAYIIMIMTAFFAGIFVGCEDQEDTWDEFTGDGRIRYTGKCTDVALKLGWEEVVVSWKNTLDPNRESILVEWLGNVETRDTVLDKDAVSCTISNLGNVTYTFRVYAVDKDGRRSLGTEAYGRPFSMAHEALNGFTPVVTKCFPLGNDKLVLYFDRWQSTLASANIQYYKKSNPEELVSLKLTGIDSVLKQKYYVLEDVELAKPVSVDRKGQLQELPGVNITFESLELDVHQRIFNSDFVREVQTHHFVKELDEDFINTVEVLEFDYNLSTLEDLLYFPNLKKVVLGKNRYLYDAYKDVVTQSVLTDTAGSRFALEVLHELKGVEVERYNKHYFPKSFSALSEKGKTEMPVLNYLTTAKITVTPADQSGYDAHPELLLDDDQITIWNPQQKNTFRQHELLIDLGKVESVAGFKVVQDATSPINNPWDSKHNFRPSLLKVLVSKDLASWEGATFDEDNEIGNTAGEITLLRMEQAKEIRYIKVTVSDLAYYSNFCVILADFVAFSE